ncbi:hypothetical protein LSH36_1188g00006 [Paralvinella palmiformis]|uniref:Uncharacterized protein n=1 Tax=Paralvinella palmiformis TaxID=53620 RepID=A0AAD9MS37_9ANNE|nr:hypothetical protein LSH36_1188g00006 [Paralvinella palmiformis]
MARDGHQSGESNHSGAKTPPGVVEDDDKVKLKRELTVGNGVGLIVGTIIGSGIFLTPKGVMLASKSIGLSLVIWVLCGIISLIGSVCYAELGTTIRRSGGDYAYILESFGPLPAFLQLWVNLIIIRPTAQAIVAMTFAVYALQPLYPCGPPDIPVRILAAVCICTLTFINGRSVRWATRIQDLFTAAKLLALIMIIVTGLVLLFMGKTEYFSKPFEGSTTDPGDISLAIYSGLFSYAGWNFLNFVTEEMKNPQKDMPRAIYISITIVTIVYVLTNVAYFALVSPAEMMMSDAVAVLFGERIYGVMSWVVPVFVSLSCFGGVNGLLFTSGRLFFVGAREGQLPDIVSMIHVTRFTPLPAMLFSCFLSLLYLIGNDMWVLINYMSFVQWLSVGMSIAGMLYLRFKRPDLPRPIKLPLIVPFTFLFFVLFLLIVPLYAAPYDTGMGLVIVLSGVPVYLVGVVWKKKPKAFRRMMRDWTVRIQKLLEVTSQEGPVKM